MADENKDMKLDGKDKFQFPIEFIKEFKVIKVEENPRHIKIGTINEPDIDLIHNMHSYFQNKSIEFVTIDERDLNDMINKMQSDSSEMEEVYESLENIEGIDEKNYLQKIAEDAPIVNLVNRFLIDAIRENATDLHLEAYEDHFCVKLRIDSRLMLWGKYSPKLFPAVSSRIKIMSQLNIAERRLPQDGQMTVHLYESKVDVRVSIVPVVYGESIVLRLLNRSKKMHTLDDLGLLDNHKDILFRLTKNEHGAVVITGPTGSGKTTTLHSLLLILNSKEDKIITIEDPVEYKIPGINQISINNKIGLTFESMLRRILRQDPNIIMIGEMRDKITCDLALRASLTGHLVFSTLHTNDAVSAITRLLNMEIEPYIIESSLIGVIAQRLVRKICDNCRVSLKPEPAMQKLFDKHELDITEIYKGQGCDDCRNSGYKGITGVFEIFELDDTMHKMIIQRKSTMDYLDYLKKQKYKTMIYDGLTKVKMGMTTPEEVIRVAAGV